MALKHNIAYRKALLKNLLQILQKRENEVIEALYKDFKKPAFEAIATETAYVLSDLKNTIRHLNRWAKPKRVWPSLLNFPSTDKIVMEPYGNVLIIAPWNYPFQLTLCPLIAAVAAGNKVVVKPSEHTPATTKVIESILQECFDAEQVSVEIGGVEKATQLLQQRWDYIFFTGSVAVGKIVAKAAALHLTPVTLELGGKNPCIVTEKANCALAAKRIAWGKFLNAGQTCIAPDYLLVHQSSKTELIKELIRCIELFYGKNPQLSPDYPRIINAQNFKRLTECISEKNLLWGGVTDKSDLYIAPTLLDIDDLSLPVMHDEIFGPILPIITYQNDSELDAVIHKYEKPLSLYVFSNSTKEATAIIQKYAFGGGCINDTVVHFSNKRLPFGGVGYSGMGAYHGKLGFETFSHKKGIVHKSNLLDIPLRYAPYQNKLKFIKKLLNWL